jgi:aminopeptidase
MSIAMDNLADIMEKTDRVRITGNGTDLTFSIKGLPAIKCDGKLNIPDGEVFSAPIRHRLTGPYVIIPPAFIWELRLKISALNLRTVR